MATEALDAAGIDGRKLAGIGITNQRETVVAWDRDTGEPLHRAIVWQDRRTSERCDELKEEGHEELFRERTGLVLDSYFSGTKIEWLIKHGDVDPGAAFGTIDSWLVFKLTGRHVTDYSNASRTLLFDIRKLGWDEELCELLGVPPESLAEPCQERGGLRRDGGVRRQRARGGHRRRPAGGALRPGLPRARPGQEHLRHRQLRARERRAPRRPTRARACSPPWPGASRIAWTTRSRPRSS